MLSHCEIGLKSSAVNKICAYTSGRLVGEQPNAILPHPKIQVSEKNEDMIAWALKPPRHHV